MACMTLFAQPMATTQLVRVAQYEDLSVQQTETNVDHSALRMSWVVVTGNNGKRELQMQWASRDEHC
jgi:hypothetical protein